jgi:transposase
VLKPPPTLKRIWPLNITGWAVRRGKKRAIMAVAHTIWVMAYYILSRQEPYREAGADYFERRQPESIVRHLHKRLEALGYQVTLQKQAAPALA